MTRRLVRHVQRYKQKKTEKVVTHKGADKAKTVRGNVKKQKG